MITDELYRTYLSALIAGKKETCFFITKDLLSKNITLTDLYLNLFQQSLYEIGTLWENNKISVATEHLATSITEYLLSLAYPRLFNSPKSGKQVIIACIAKEYHQIGAKMIADIFEMHQWDAYFLGSNTPVDDLLEMITETQPDLVGLSLSIYFNLEILLATLKKIKKAFPHLSVIVGGQAFRFGGIDTLNQFDKTTFIQSIEILEQYLSTEKKAL